MYIIMVYYQNPPAFKIHPIKFLFCYLLDYFKIFVYFMFTSYLFFTIAITPNPYPRLVSGSQI